MQGEDPIAGPISAHQIQSAGQPFKLFSIGLRELEIECGDWGEGSRIHLIGGRSLPQSLLQQTVQLLFQLWESLFPLTSEFGSDFMGRAILSMNTKDGQSSSLMGVGKQNAGGDGLRQNAAKG